MAAAMTDSISILGPASLPIFIALSRRSPVLVFPELLVLVRNTLSSYSDFLLSAVFFLCSMAAVCAGLASSRAARRKG